MIYVLDYIIYTIWKGIKSEGIKKSSSSFKSWVSSFAPKYYPKLQRFLYLFLQLLANEKSWAFSKPVAYSIVSQSSKLFCILLALLTYRLTIFLLCICIINIYSIIIISYHSKETFLCVNGRKYSLMKYNVIYKTVSVRLGHISKFHTDFIRYKSLYKMNVDLENLKWAFRYVTREEEYITTS